MANKNLSATISIGGTVAGSLINALGSTKTKLIEVGKAITDLSRKEKSLGNAINVLSRQGQEVGNLRREYVQTIQAVERLRVAQTRLNAASKTHGKLTAASGTLTGASVKTGIAGGAVIASVVPGVSEAKHFETEMAKITALGMGEKTNIAAFEFAKSMKTYGTSQLENLEMMRDGLSIFSDLHHAETLAPIMAKMKFANAAVFGAEHGASNTAAFQDMLKVIELRGGANDDATALKHADFIQQVISATGGRVKGDEWRNAMSTGNTAAKLMRDDAFYYQLEPLIQMMGGDKVGTGLSAAYTSLYQGRTTKRAAMNLDAYGLIGDQSKVKHDKAGQVSFLNPGALLGSKLFRESQYEWVKQVLLPALEKKGVTDKKEIVDVIASFVSNRKGADMLGAMVLQQGIIDKDIQRNKGSANIEQLDAQARNSARGKELDAQAKLADLKLRVGAQILPIYAKGLEIVASGLEKLNKFAEKNPTLMKTIVIGVTGLGAALVVLAPVLLATAGAMTIYANAQLLLALRGIAPLASGAGMLSGALSGVLAVIRPLALAFMIASPPALLLVAAGAALVATGIAIYKYWEPLKAFFVGFGEGILTGLEPVASAFSAAFEPVMPILSVIGGWIKDAATWVGNLFTPIDTLSSTTKAFGVAGVTAGEAVGKAFTLLLKPVTAVLTAMKWIYDNAAGIGNGIGSAVRNGAKKLGLTGDGGGAIPAAPPLASGKMYGAAGNVTNSTNITINQQPGQDSRALAAEVAKELERRNGVARRSSMTDGVGAQ